MEGQHEDGWGKLRKHSLLSSTALARSISEGGICGGGMVGVQQQLAGNCITATTSAAALEVAGRCRPAAVGLHCR